MIFVSNTIQHNTIQYNTIQYNTIQYNTIQYNTKSGNSRARYPFWVFPLQNRVINLRRRWHIPVLSRLSSPPVASKSFINKLFCPFWVNLKAEDTHFLDVSEKETIFLVGAWLFYVNQNFFRFKGKLSLNKISSWNDRHHFQTLP